MAETRPLERDRALAAVDQIRAAIAGEDLQQALEKIDALQELLADWKRSDARDWLEENLHSDLLTFNIEAANQRLAQWQSAVKDGGERELDHYRQRVTERARQKQGDLQARGVIAHCEDLWRKVSELERADPPGHPDHLLKNYLIKARDVATAATAETPGNPSLESLLQRADRFVTQKTALGRIYRDALDHDRYAEALEALERVLPGDLIPRFRVIADLTSKDSTAFDRMVTPAEAREELERLAWVWAADQALTLMQRADEALRGFQPQAALEKLAGRDRLDRFLKEDVRAELRAVEARATHDLRLLETAERRARQALRLADENPIGAWDLYAEAHQTYSGAPTLNPTRERIIAGMVRQLEQALEDAENAFNSKRMEQVIEIGGAAQTHFTGKDPSLEGLLTRLEEYRWQAQTYQDYLRSAAQMLDQIQELVYRDIVQAGELLGQLDSTYPPVVLEDLPALADVRAEVRRRLNAEVMYNQLYKLLLSGNTEEIARGIAATESSSGEARFAQLKDALELHLTFLDARRHYADGQSARALPLLQVVAASPGHPDAPAARDLIEEIEDAPDQGGSASAPAEVE
jgi:hypothetical protein